MKETDRELLENAAKAAGIDFNCWPHTNVPGRPWESREWNPLKDDGDALRLAVKLDIWVHPDPTTVEVIGVKAVYEHLPSDPYVATRRAIVRAAAEIGKAMP